MSVLLLELICMYVPIRFGCAKEVQGERERERERERGRARRGDRGAVVARG